MVIFYFKGKDAKLSVILLPEKMYVIYKDSHICIFKLGNRILSPV